MNNKNSISVIKKVYGIGKFHLYFFYKKFGLNIRTRTLFIKYKTFKKIQKLINSITFRGSLKVEQIKIRKYLIERVKNYNSFRHLNRHPVRGQRTHTNAKTRKFLVNKNSMYLT